jgi:hypothetical protein
MKAPLYTLLLFVWLGAGAEERPAGGLPPPAAPAEAPRFGFKPVEEQPPPLQSFTQRQRSSQIDDPAARGSSGDRSPGAYTAPAAPLSEPGLELRRQGDPTVQGRLPQLRRYGDLTREPAP